MEENMKKDTPIFYKKEMIINGGSVLLLSLICLLFGLFFSFPEEIIKITKGGEVLFSYDKSLIIPSIVFSILSEILLILINIFYPTTKEKPSISKISKLFFFIILSILGVFAHFILMQIFKIFINMNYLLNIFLTTVIFLSYSYMMYKLYILDYVENKSVFYEIFRFALVGVIASLFDFSTCYLFQYIFLPQTLAPIYLTIISVTMGFIVGVTVNYLCSVYMVFKSTTDKNCSKSINGILLFVVLSAAGLFIGIGLQFLFYDYLHISYIITFIIRTLVVLFWNYTTRKKFIFK